MYHDYMEIFLFLAFVVVVAKGAGWLATKIGQPAVLGEILAGLLLGPTLLNFTSLPLFPESRNQTLQFNRERMAAENVYRAHVDRGENLTEQGVASKLMEETETAVSQTPEASLVHENDREALASGAAEGFRNIFEERKSFLQDIIKALAEIGVLFLMFMAGLETDLVMMKRVGKVAFWAAMGGVIVPFFLGLFVTMLMLPQHGIYAAVFAGSILCATSVSISAQTLKELGALTSKEGTTILGAAVIDDVLGIIVLSLVIAFNPGSPAGGEAFPKLYQILTGFIGRGMSEPAADVAGIALLVTCMALFFFLFYFFGARFFDRILTWAESLPVSEPKLAFAIALGFIFAWGAEYIGAVAAITGTYFAGVLIGQTSHRHEITEKLGILTYSFLVPIFFINIGLEANARVLAGNMLWFTILIVIVAIGGKVVGCLFGARWSGFNRAESVRVGIGMISRGEVGLIVASVGLSSGIIGKDVFSAMIIMVLATTLTTPVLLRFVFPREPKPA
jgi:Kef-type K+ transport system membrane component KefB